MKFKVVLYQSDDGVSVKCPTLPGCVTQGETVEEALQEIQIGIREFLEAIWGEVNQNIAEDLAEYADLKVSLDEVEVDIEGVEHTQPQTAEEMAKYEALYGDPRAILDEVEDGVEHPQPQAIEAAI